MERQNNNKILLTLSREDQGFGLIDKIIDLNDDKTFDIVYLNGIDLKGEDRFRLEELADYAAAMPQIDKCYACDISELVEILRNDIDPERLLGDYQMRHIVKTMFQAQTIINEGYDKAIYYSVYTDYRLTEIPGSMILDDAEYICLMCELEDTSPKGLAARRRIANAVNFVDHKPEYGYSMEEEDIRKLCRKIIQSGVLETLELVEINHNNIENI